MNVYFVTWHSPLSPEAPAQRIKNYLQCIIDAGLPCELLLKKQDKPVNLIKLKTLKPQNLKTVLGHCPLRPHYRRMAFCLLSEVATLVYLLFKLRRHDVVFFYDRDIFWGKLLISVAHLKQSKAICDLCEIPFGDGATKTLQHVQDMPIRQAQDKLRAKYEREILSRVDGIIPISDALAEYAKVHTKSDCIITKIPILVDFDQYSQTTETHNKTTKQLKNKTTKYLFHAGTLYEQKDGILGVLEAFGKATKRLDFPIRFISTGYKERSPHRKQIDEIIDKYGLQEKVIFTGFLSDAELRDYQQKASMVIINKYPNEQNTFCFSTKLGEYMAAGKAVVITRVGEAMNWLKDRDDALIIEPNDNEALVQAIVTLFTDSDLRIRLGQSARKHCKEYFDYRRWSPALKEMIYKEIRN